jgi:hypothetical protein
LLSKITLKTGEPKLARFFWRAFHRRSYLGRARAKWALSTGGGLPPPSKTQTPRVTREFLSLAETISYHNSHQKWTLLYRALWRLTLGGETHLLKITTDPDILNLVRMRKEISRDIHKMHAFVASKKPAKT